MPRSLLRFRPRPKLRPAKASLRADVQQKVERGIARLPILGAQNPAAACLAVDFIDDWIGDGGPDDDRTQAPPPDAVCTEATSQSLFTPMNTAATLATYAALALALGQDPIAWLTQDHPRMRRVS